MIPATQFDPGFRVSIDGIPVKDLEYNMIRMEVHSTVGMPSMFHMVIGDYLDDKEKEYHFLDSSTFRIGKKVEIFGLKSDDGTPYSLIEGSISAIEPDFRQNGTLQLHIRGFDASVSLSQGKKSNTYLKKTDSQIIKAIATGNRLTAMVDSTTQKREHVTQLNQTDWEFIQQLAARNGMKIYYQKDKLHCKKIDSMSSATVTLNWGGNLGSFRPRMSALGQKSTYTTTGWDTKTKQKISSKSSTATTTAFRDIGARTTGGSSLKDVTGSKAKSAAINLFADSSSDLAEASKSALLEYESNFVQAEGECIVGEPKLLAGTVVKIEDVGKTFSGKYFITEARHEFEGGQYHVSFSIHGTRPETINSLLVQEPLQASNKINGVVPAIVTNNDDSSADFQAARVKVKYPWFVSEDGGGEMESGWARLAVVGGGDQRGIYFMPEVNDEVLVAFEQGDINRPYIIGGLWNGKDKTVSKNADTIKGGKVNLRTIRTRSGHVIQLDDTSGSEKISIIDKSEGNSIVLDTKNNTITIKAKKDLVFDAGGKLVMKCQDAFEVNAKGAAKVESMQGVEIQANSAMKLSSKQSVAIQDSGSNKLNLGPASADLQGMLLNLKASGIAQLQGALVKIN